MTKKELEELVAQQQEIIDGLYEEIERVKVNKAERIAELEAQIEGLKNRQPVLPTAPTMPVTKPAYNGPWPSFTIRTVK